ncbi:MAG: hypothetical protein ACJA0H_000902 [Francisellaceae bacterium]|jgi:hypothetical protein
MELLNADVDTAVIAMLLEHESMQTTEVYMHAHMGLKEFALAKVEPFNKHNALHYDPDNKLASSCRVTMPNKKTPLQTNIICINGLYMVS